MAGQLYGEFKGFFPENAVKCYNTFPNGQAVDYESDNVILDDLTKEYIVGKRLFPYIPFYIARYEKDISSEGEVDKALAIFTSEGRLIVVEATSVWDMCWLVSPTISASCSCDIPADKRAARILCPNHL